MIVVQTRRFIRETSSGGVTVNSVMDHAMFPHLPFGGTGNSGMSLHYSLGLLTRAGRNSEFRKTKFQIPSGPAADGPNFSFLEVFDHADYEYDG